PNPLRVDADRRAIKQIVLNLLTNSLKFTPSGGHVTVILRQEGDEASIVVADNGVGISAVDLVRLGRPYEQAGDAQQRARGSGLGLSLVRAFADLHGGRMTIQSEAGEGTVVSVRLPVVTAAAGPAVPGAGPPPMEPVSLGDNVIRFTPDRRSER
ncbi:MAG: sensor histidine kinase, partial [Caulobacteraceae bacterium]